MTGSSPEVGGLSGSEGFSQAEIESLQQTAARAAHAAQDRMERSTNLYFILGEPDANYRRLARFVAWADVHAEDQVETAVNAVLAGLPDLLTHKRTAARREGITAASKMCADLLTQREAKAHASGVREGAAEALRKAADAFEGTDLELENMPRNLWDFREWLRVRASLPQPTGPQTEDPA